MGVDRCFEGFVQQLNHFLQMCLAAQCRDENELVGAQARNIRIASCLTETLFDVQQAVCGFFQNEISGAVAQGVVDAFELIQIEGKQRKLLLALTGQGFCVELNEAVPVRQLRQGVVERQLMNACFRLLALGDITDDHQRHIPGLRHYAGFIVS